MSSIPKGFNNEAYQYGMQPIEMRDSNQYHNQHQIYPHNPQYNNSYPQNPLQNVYPQAPAQHYPQNYPEHELPHNSTSYLQGAALAQHSSHQQTPSSRVHFPNQSSSGMDPPHPHNKDTADKDTAKPKIPQTYDAMGRPLGFSCSNAGGAVKRNVGAKTMPTHMLGPNTLFSNLPTRLTGQVVEPPYKGKPRKFKKEGAYVTVSKKPVSINCPFCNYHGYTQVNRVFGCCAGSVVIVLLCSFPPLAWLPLCSNCCKDVRHLCPHCQRSLGRIHPCGGTIS